MMDDCMMGWMDLHYGVELGWSILMEKHHVGVKGASDTWMTLCIQYRAHGPNKSTPGFKASKYSFASSYRVK